MLGGFVRTEPETHSPLFERGFYRAYDGLGRTVRLSNPLQNKNGKESMQTRSHVSTLAYAITRLHV